MSEFTVIETQEQFDAMVKERVDRARRTAIKETEEKYQDYASIKEQLEKKDTEVSTLRKTVADLESKGKDSGKELADMTAKLTATQNSLMKIKVATAVGLPSDLADRLTGENEEEMTEDAKKIKALMGNTHKAPPLATKETGGTGNSKREALRGMLHENRE